MSTSEKEHAADDVQSRALAQELLNEAGLGELLAFRPLGDYSNAHYVAVAADGSDYVLRRFLDNRAHSPLARLERECWAYELLARRGAPVPRPLSYSITAGAEATLTPLVEGNHLGTIIGSLPRRDAARAWAACGRAFSLVHAIDSDAAAHAGCEAVGIRKPHASRGPWHRDEALKIVDRLESARPDLGSCRDVRDAVEAASPLYERAPRRLCQYDAHLWQFLVASDDGGDWSCTAILDWEHADLDDPDWDLAMLDGFRWGQVGPVPSGFFAGYGRVPASPLFTLYRLERAAWILTTHAGGENAWLDLSVPPAERFVRELLAAVDPLRHRIEIAISS